MKKVVFVTLLLLAFSTGAIQAEESPAAHLGGSWLANCWEALADLVEAVFAGSPKPTPPPETTTADGDCGAAMDPTGGCGG